MPFSSVAPDGPLARGIKLLSDLGHEVCVNEIKRLLVERLQFREDALQAKESLRQTKRTLIVTQEHCLALQARCDRLLEEARRQQSQA